jgi:hypothetical protein
LNAKEQYFKEIADDMSRFNKLRQTLAQQKRIEHPVTEEERYEQVVNNTPRIRHNMPHNDVRIYDAFVKMLLRYNQDQISDIIQGAQSAASDLKLLSQYGKNSHKRSIEEDQIENIGDEMFNFEKLPHQYYKDERYEGDTIYNLVNDT